MMNKIASYFSGFQGLLFQSIFFILSVIALITPALENGFPILHTDSATYFLMGYLDKIPVGRPISYALFVRFSSLQYSSWFTIIFQAIITTWLIFLTLKVFFPSKSIAMIGFMAISILSFTTGLSHYVSQIMSDLYLSLAILGYFIILFKEKMRLILLIPLAILVILSGIMHMSNLPVLTAVLLSFGLISVIYKKGFRHLIQKRALTVMLILVISWLTIPTINYFYKDGFRISSSNNVVLFSRFIETGAAQNYIKYKCEQDSTFKLCKYEEEIVNCTRFDKFLWGKDSYLYKDEACEGEIWDDCWKIRNAEFGTINREILNHSESLRLFLKATGMDFLRQIVYFRLIYFISFKEGSYMDYPIKSFFPADRQAFLRSNQVNGTLYYEHLNDIQFATVILSLIALSAMLIMKFFKKEFYYKTWSLLLFILPGIIMSSLITVLFAPPSGRFTGRLIWLIPFLVIVMAYKIYQERRDGGEGK
jgi:hypothetical protein